MPGQSWGGGKSAVAAHPTNWEETSVLDHARGQRRRTKPRDMYTLDTQVKFHQNYKESNKV